MYLKTAVLLIFLTCILMYSCSSEKPKAMDSSQNPFKHITIIDTFTNLLQPRVSENYRTVLEIPPFYIGKNTSEIFLEYDSPTELSLFEVFHGELFSDRSILTDDHLNNLNLSIYVDTSRHIGNYTSSYQRSCSFFTDPATDTLPSKAPTYTRGDILSYPIFIKNNRSHPVLIGYVSSLFFYLQAQDNSGSWHTISRFPSYCVSGSNQPHHFYLRSQQIALASCPVFIGNYKTKLRLSFAYHHSEIEKNQLYSNEFTGYINYDLVHPKETSL